MITFETFERFTKHDWDSFAGAELFDDGSEPFIGCFNEHGDPDEGWLVVVDKNDMEASTMGDIYYRFSSDNVLNILNTMQRIEDIYKREGLIKATDLMALGFKEV